MRLAVWTYTAAIGFASLAVAAVGAIFGNIYYYRFDNFHGRPLPAITSLLVNSHWWPLAFALLWLGGAVWLSRHGAATQDRVVAFAGISTLTITFLFMFTAIAVTLPFIAIIVRMR